MPVPATAVLLTCLSLAAVDGDTINCDGTNMRDMGAGSPYLDGYDTPEIRRARCEKERELGRIAKARMDQLLRSEGVKVYDSGQRDSTRAKRPLVWIVLEDGKSIGEIMIAEGLARRWSPAYIPDWC